MTMPWSKTPTNFFLDHKLRSVPAADAFYFLAIVEYARSSGIGPVLPLSALVGLPVGVRSKTQSISKMVSAGLLADCRQPAIGGSVAGGLPATEGSIAGELQVNCRSVAGQLQAVEILNWPFWSCSDGAVSAGRGPVKQRQLPENDLVPRARARKKEREKENTEPIPSGSDRFGVPASAAPRDARGAAPRLPNDGEVVASDVVSAPAGPEQQDPDPDDGPPMTKEEAREEMRRLIQKSRFHRKDRNDIVPKGWSAKERAEAASGVTGEGKPEPEHIGYLTTGIIPPSQNGHSTWQADKGDPDGEPA